MSVNLRRIIIILALFMQVACVDNITEHGIKVKQEELDRLKVGVTRQSVAKSLLGPPTIMAERDGKDIWVYVNYQKNKRALLKPVFASHDVIELEFSRSRLSKINQHDKYALNKLRYLAYKTPSKANSGGVLKQLLSNVGRFNGSNDL